MNKNQNPLFLRFINKEVGVIDLLNIFSRSNDPLTHKAAMDAQMNPPNLEVFRNEFEDAVRDLIRDGSGEDISAFMTHYLSSVEMDRIESKGSNGQNVSLIPYVKDPESEWVEGLICFNLKAYIIAYGMNNLKICRICGKIFAHKGQYAVYCSDSCKAKGKKVSKYKEPEV
jgi:hypothetical protein